MWHMFNQPYPMDSVPQLLRMRVLQDPPKNKAHNQPDLKRKRLELGAQLAKCSDVRKKATIEEQIRLLNHQIQFESGF
jgi:hypothetical protein